MPIQDLPRRVYVTYSNQDPTETVLNFGDSEDSTLDNIVNDMNNADATGVYELVRFITTEGFLKGPATDTSPVEESLSTEDDGA